MHERGCVQQFDRRAQGDKSVLGSAQHFADEKAESGADALATRGQNLLQGGAQVRMALVGLRVKTRFDELKLCLHR